MTSNESAHSLSLMISKTHVQIDHSNRQYNQHYRKKSQLTKPIPDPKFIRKWGIMNLSLGCSFSLVKCEKTTTHNSLAKICLYASSEFHCSMQNTINKRQQIRCVIYIAFVAQKTPNHLLLSNEVSLNSRKLQYK